LTGLPGWSDAWLETPDQLPNVHADAHGTMKQYSQREEADTEKNLWNTHLFFFKDQEPIKVTIYILRLLIGPRRPG